MKKYLKGVILLLLSFTTFLSAQSQDSVRTPAVAGMFYPANPRQLKTAIMDYLSKTKAVVKGDIRGLVAPHAGYVYSGPVAAWSYKQIEGKKYEVVVVIAPSHFEYFRGASVFPGKFYQTPLGNIPIDLELCRKLTETSSDISLEEEGHHISPGGRGEHALEVQLPFLQTVLKDFKLVPIVMADQSLEMVNTLAEGLAKTLKDRNFLLVASSDLSHYRSYQDAYNLDEGLLNAFSDDDYTDIVNKCENRKFEACGYGPIATVMHTCSLLGYDESRMIKYATSGDVPQGEKSQVVGYMSGAIYK